MIWTHTTSHVSRIFHWRISWWRNAVGYGCVLLFLWGWRLLIVGNCFAMGLRKTTTTILLVSGNSWNKFLLIASILISQQIQGRWKIKYITLITLIMKVLCIPVRDSTIPVLLLVIQRSAQYWISQSLLLWLLLLAIRIQRKFNCTKGGIIGRIVVTSIGGYLMEIEFWILVSGNSMSVWFGLGGGPTTVNIISVTALHRIVTPPLVFLDVFDVWIVHNNDYCLV